MNPFFLGAVVIGLIFYGIKKERAYEEKATLNKIKTASRGISEELKQEFMDTNELIVVFSDLITNSRKLNSEIPHQLFKFTENDGVEGKSLAEAKILNLRKIKALNDKIANTNNLSEAQALAMELQILDLHNRSLNQSIATFLEKYKESSQEKSTN